jgi:quercetin dioxygenase-like cupin family protein/DNA-binding XRE family transcriptional regulator
MPKAEDVGTRIKTFRERLELSQEELATNAGLSLSLVQSIEAGKAQPAIGVLIKLSRALGQRLGTFLDDKVSADPLIVRANEVGKCLSPHSGEEGGAYTYHSLGAGKTDRHMEPLFVELGADQNEPQSSHEGEEFIIVIKGEVELSYGKEKKILQAGDTAYYNSIVPHALSASGGQAAAIYAVIFQPL